MPFMTPACRMVSAALATGHGRRDSSFGLHRRRAGKLRRLLGFGIASMQQLTETVR
jgi:hypothetical protein